MNEVLGLNHFDWGWGALRQARVTSELRLSDALIFCQSAPNFSTPPPVGETPFRGERGALGIPQPQRRVRPSDVAAHTWCNFLAAPR